MSDNLLKQAKQWRELVLLAELGGWLHDLGKLSSGFVLRHTDEQAYNLPGEAEARQKSSEQAEASDDKESDDGEWDHEKVFRYDADAIPGGLRTFLQQSISGPEQARVKSGLAGLVRGHHRKGWDELNHIQHLLKRADGDDSGEDEYNAVGIRQKGKIQAATVFGKEELLAGGKPATLDERRKALYPELARLLIPSRFPNNRGEVWERLKEMLQHGLGKTQRAANDVRLDQHVWGVTARFKAFLMRDLLDEPARKKDGTYETRGTFRLLTIQWNSWELITPFARLSDVVGREVMLENLREQLSRLIEDQYALGNAVYADDDGVHFLIADGNWKADLFPRIREAVNRATGGETRPVIRLSGSTHWVTDLVAQMEQARHALPIVGGPAWTEEWIDSPSGEVCPVCQRRPLEGERELCPWCEERRGEGIRERLAKEGTVWTGEIADKNGRVALVLARFDLERWLDGEMLHTLFITSPQDIAQAGDVKNASAWDWRFLHDLLPDLEEAQEAIAQRDEREQTIAARKRSQKRLLEEQEKVEAHRDEIVANEQIPQERKTDLLSELDERLTEIANELDAVIQESAHLERLQAQPLSMAEHLADHIRGKRGQEQRVQEMAERTRKRYQLHPEDAFLLALARKNPSTSRLLRAWQTTEAFLDEQARGLSGRMEERERAVFTLDRRARPGIYTAEVPGLGRSEIFIRPEGRQAQTITHLRSDQVTAVERHAPGAQLRLTDRERGRPLREPLTYTIVEVETETYRPYQVISVSPNLLLAMVPADEAPGVAEDMQEAYAEEFGKVQGRLPFHVGLVFMDAHYPMFAALDTARRLAESFDDLSDDTVEADLVKTARDDSSEHLVLSMRSDRFGDWTWHVPAQRGDGETDWYHPYFLVRDGENLEGRKMSLTGPHGRWVHVSQLEAGDRLAFWPNLFDFLFLDTVSRRLEAQADVDQGRRRHPLLGLDHSPRPYLLERVARIREVWDAIRGVPGMSETRLTAAASLLARKWDTWRLAESDDADLWETYRWLAREVVNRDLGGDGPVDLQQAILNGTFFDAVELHRHILKHEI